MNYKDSDLQTLYGRYHLSDQTHYQEQHKDQSVLEVPWHRKHQDEDHETAIKYWHQMQLLVNQKFID